MQRQNKTLTKRKLVEDLPCHDGSDRTPRKKTRCQFQETIASTSNTRQEIPSPQNQWLPSAAKANNEVINTGDTSEEAKIIRVVNKVLCTELSALNSSISTMNERLTSCFRKLLTLRYISTEEVQARLKNSTLAHPALRKLQITSNWPSATVPKQLRDTCQARSKSKCETIVKNVLTESTSQAKFEDSSPEQSQSSQTNETNLQQKVPCYVAPNPASLLSVVNSRSSKQTVQKKVIIRNNCQWQPGLQKGACTHLWTLTVTGENEDISTFVKKVVVHLHESYKPNDEEVLRSPPFEVRRMGWGEFEVKVDLHFWHRLDPVTTFFHKLVLRKVVPNRTTLGNETVCVVSVHETDEKDRQDEVSSKPFSWEEYFPEQSTEFNNVASVENPLLNRTVLDSKETDQHMAIPVEPEMIKKNEKYISILKPMAEQIVEHDELMRQRIIATIRAEHDYAFRKLPVSSQTKNALGALVAASSTLRSTTQATSREQMKTNARLARTHGVYFNEIHAPPKPVIANSLSLLKKPAFHSHIKAVSVRNGHNMIPMAAPQKSLLQGATSEILELSSGSIRLTSLQSQPAGVPKCDPVFFRANSLHSEHPKIENEIPYVQMKTESLPATPASFSNQAAAVKYYLKKFPLFAREASTTAYRNVHPYCSLTAQFFLEWPFAKCRASEWHRAKIVQNMLKQHSFAENIWTTKEIMLWARHHGYTPCHESETVEAPSLNTFTNSYTSSTLLQERIKEIAMKPETLIEADVDVVTVEEPQAPQRICKKDIFVSQLMDTESDANMCRHVKQMASEVDAKICTEDSDGIPSCNAAEVVLVQAWKCFAEDLLRKGLNYAWKRRNRDAKTNYQPSSLNASDIIQAIKEESCFDILTNKCLGVPRVRSEGAEQRNDTVVCKSEDL